MTDANRCEKINAYWAKRGAKANARVETRSYTIPPGSHNYGGRAILSPSMKLTRAEIVSDLVNGLPPKPVAQAA